MSLTGNISKTGPKIAVNYKLTNTGSVPIFVWDVMVGQGPKEQFLDSNLAYVCWEEPNTVRLTRAMLRLPPDHDVTVKEVPFVRKLPSQGTADGRIVLSIPVQEYNPFYPPAKDTREVPCNKVRVIIGWIEEKPGMTVSKREVGGQEVLALRGGWGPPLQRWDQIVLDCSVELAVRSDPFDRRLPME